jgi:hypothetical protein
METFSGICGANLPLTVAGAVSALALVAPHRVPIFAVRATCTNETVTPPIEETCEALSMGLSAAKLMSPFRRTRRRNDQSDKQLSSVAMMPVRRSSGRSPTDTVTQI